jgi:hypothetical protein
VVLDAGAARSVCARIFSESSLSARGEKADPYYADRANFGPTYSNSLAAGVTGQQVTESG